jgi:molybdopterin/thiamine biosynthesis adenylyltransferase/rhodanese-related sulfurtransferase
MQVCSETMPPPLTPAERSRYARHLSLPEVGLMGQQKLKASSVLLVGLGGLGSPVALYLAAAGVGRLGLVDPDTVDASNLQRQILHSERTVGQPKTVSAAARLQELNPHVAVKGHPMRLSRQNARALCADYDVIVDGTDNFASRYLVADVCVLLQKPNVHASISRFEGQLSVFDARVGPCYRCLYPEPPPPGAVPSCSEAGVLGILPGTLGVLQATETIKLLLNIGEPLIGRLLVFDALAMRFSELKIRKDPRCPLCSDNPTLHELPEEQNTCGTSETPMNDDITPQELQARLQQGPVRLIDVREPHEWEIGRIAGAELIPLGQLPTRIAELKRDEDLVLYCKAGGRSRQALEFLRGQGFTRLQNLAGGINRWSRDVDPSVPQY